jgi:hypothetical protein
MWLCGPCRKFGGCVNLQWSMDPYRPLGRSWGLGSGVRAFKATWISWMAPPMPAGGRPHPEAAIATGGHFRHKAYVAHGIWIFSWTTLRDFMARYAANVHDQRVPLVQAAFSKRRASLLPIQATRFVDPLYWKHYLNADDTVSQSNRFDGKGVVLYRIIEDDHDDTVTHNRYLVHVGPYREQVRQLQVPPQPGTGLLGNLPGYSRRHKNWLQRVVATRRRLWMAWLAETLTDINHDGDHFLYAKKRLRPKRITIK